MGVLVATCIGMCPNVEVAPFSPGLQKRLPLLSAKTQDRKLSLPPIEGKRNEYTSFQRDLFNCHFTKNFKTTIFLNYVLIYVKVLSCPKLFYCCQKP